MSLLKRELIEKIKIGDTEYKELPLLTLKDKKHRHIMQLQAETTMIPRVDEKGNDIPADTDFVKSYVEQSDFAKFKFVTGIENKQIYDELGAEDGAYFNAYYEKTFKQPIDAILAKFNKKDDDDKDSKDNGEKQKK